MNEKLIELCSDFILINRKKAFRSSCLMEYFNCESKEEFVSKCVEPTRVELTKYGEAYENHILTIEEYTSETEFLFSELAVMLMGYVFTQTSNPLKNAGLELEGMMGDAKYHDSSFFTDFKNIDLPLRVGDKVEILTTAPTALGPKTPMINYRGKVGRIHERFENGCFGVIVDCVKHEVCFSPSSLKRKVD